MKVAMFYMLVLYFYIYKSYTWHLDDMKNGFAGVVEEVLMELFLVKVALQEEEEPATTADDIFG